MMSLALPAFVITVSGVSGAGKSSTVRAIAALLEDAVWGRDSAAVKGRVAELVGDFPTVYYCFEHPTPPR